MKPKKVPYPKTGISKKALLLCAMVILSASSIFATAGPTCASVAVYASSTTLCGTSTDTFQAVLSNGGATPTYQWFENGNPVGGNSASYISTAVSSATVISVSVSGSGHCPGDTLLHSYSVTSTAQALTVGTIPSTPTIAASGLACAFKDSIYITNTSGLSFANWYVNGQVYTIPGTADSVVIDSSSRMHGPAGIAINAAGTIYVADRDSNRILTFAAGSHTGTVVIRGLNSPKAVFSAGAYLFVADNNNHRILKINATTGAIVNIFGGTQGIGLNQLNYPSDVFATGPNYDTVYVADQGNNRIQKYVVGNTSAETVAGGVYGDSYSSTGLYGPSSVCVDADGNIYVADQSNNRVMVYRPGNNVGFPMLYLSSPSVVRLDQNGSLYVTSSQLNQVYQYTTAQLIYGLSGNYVQGTPLLHSNVIFSTNLQHAGLAVSAAGKVYVCDGGHNRIILAGSASKVNQGWSLTNPYQGSYTATVVNAEGCVSASSNAVTINATDYPSISLPNYSLSSLCNGAIAHWNAQVFDTIGTSLNYIWRINGVVKQSGPSDSFTYAVNPSSTVMTLQVRSNYFCQNKDTASITALTSPSVYVSRIADTMNGLCTGVHTFTANTPVTGGIKYAWYKNGVLVGDSTNTLTIAVTLTDTIWFKMISAVNCAGANSVVSPKITIATTPQVSIYSPTACSAASSTFDAYAYGGGSNPTYTWYKNGSVVSSGSSTATFATIGGDNVWVVMTSNDPCAYPATVSSAKTIMVLTPNTPALTGGTCLGSAISLGNNQNGTTTIWLKDFSQIAVSNLTGAGGYPYIPGIAHTMVPPYVGSYTAMVATVTPTTTCYSQVSNAIIISPVSPLSVSVTSTSTEACSASAITFTANASNATAYQWFKNNIPVGTGSTYTASGFNYNDSVWVRVVSNTPCVSPTLVVSNKIYIRTASSSSPSVGISANTTNLNAGITIVFTASPSNAGLNPTYAWYKNGVLISGVSSPVLSYGGQLANGDQIYVILTSRSCGAAQTATSNTIILTKTGSSAKEIIALTMPAQVNTSVINSAAATVDAVVTTAPAQRTAIHPTRLNTTVGASYGPSYAVNRDFSHPVTYTVVAADGTSKVWTVTVVDQNNNKTGGSTMINDIALTTNISVYPNPAEAYLMLTAAGGGDAPAVTVIDIEGRVMYSQKLPVTDYINHMIDLSDYSNGTYVVYIEMGGKIQSKQFIVSKQK